MGEICASLTLATRRISTGDIAVVDTRGCALTEEDGNANSAAAIIEDFIRLLSIDTKTEPTFQTEKEAH